MAGALLERLRSEQPQRYPDSPSVNASVGTRGPGAASRIRAAITVGSAGLAFPSMLLGDFPRFCKPQANCMRSGCYAGILGFPRYGLCKRHAVLYCQTGEGAEIPARPQVRSLCGGSMLNRRSLIQLPLAAAAFIGASAVATLPQSGDTQRSLNLVGEIMDSRCAINGSHQQIMAHNGTTTAADCTLACAKNGGSFVLYDPDTKTVYQLDDQKKPVRFAGQRVRVSGTYDEASKTMHVQDIELAG
jgi:hypothetical protein